MNNPVQVVVVVVVVVVVAVVVVVVAEMVMVSWSSHGLNLSVPLRPCMMLFVCSRRCPTYLQRQMGRCVRLADV